MTGILSIVLSALVSIDSHAAYGVACWLTVGAVYLAILAFVLALFRQEKRWDDEFRRMCEGQREGGLRG